MTKSKRVKFIRILLILSIVIMAVNIISRLIRPIGMDVPTLVSPSGIQLECCIAAGILSITLWKNIYKSRIWLIISILIPILNGIVCIIVYVIRNV